MLAVRLSKRNVLTLLAKLELDDTSRVIMVPSVYCTYDKPVIVEIEPDEKHYRDRQSIPGRMKTEVEEFIEQWQVFINTRKSESNPQ